MNAEPLSERQLRAGRGRDHHDEPARQRHDPARTERPLSAQRSESDRPCRSGETPLVHRYGHGARRATVERTRAVVSQPVGAKRCGRGGARRGRRGTRTGRREQHARHRSRRPDVGAGRSRIAAGRAVRRTRHARRQCVLRNADGTCDSARTRRSIPIPAICTRCAITGRTGWITCNTCTSAGMVASCGRSNIPVPGMTMVHDMSLTPNYVVVYDLPVTINLEMAMAGSNFPFAWNNDYQPRVGLLPRNGEAKDIVWVEVGACYVFHPMNAFEDAQGRVVIDRVPLPADVRSRSHGSVRRQSGDAGSLDDRSEGAPRERRTHRRSRAGVSAFDPAARSTKPYRFGYSVAVRGNGFPSIIKHDLDTGTSTTFEFGAGRHGAEPYFVAREDAKAEDDGYLMTFVYDEATGKSELVVLNAQDLSRRRDCDRASAGARAVRIPRQLDRRRRGRPECLSAR